MGVHTGDSITVAPAQTLTDVGTSMRAASLAILEKIGVRPAAPTCSSPSTRKRPHDRHRDEPPRVALLGARVEGHGLPHREGGREAAVGYTLDEIVNDITKATPACFEPSIDYCVVKVPRSRSRFQGARRHAVHAHEGRRRGHGHRPNVRGIARQGHALAGERARGPGSRRQGGEADASDEALEDLVARPTAERLLPSGRGAASRLDG